MTFVYGFIAGILVWYLIHRILLAYGFERIRQMQKDRFKSEILGKAGYDRLLKFREAVDEEIAKRKGDA